MNARHTLIAGSKTHCNCLLAMQTHTEGVFSETNFLTCALPPPETLRRVLKAWVPSHFGTVFSTFQSWTELMKLLSVFRIMQQAVETGI